MNVSLELPPVASLLLQERQPGGPLHVVAINAKARQLLKCGVNASEPEVLTSLEQLLAAEAALDLRRCWQENRQTQAPLSWQGQRRGGADPQWLLLELASDQQGNWQAVLIESSVSASEAFNNEAAKTALAITEAIPVGTYTMVLKPGSPMASFSFLSERFLALTGLERQEALADPLKAFACVHPDDYDEWVRLNAEVFEKKLPFFGQTRVVVNGEVRWITDESVPRDLADGSTVWEGVLIDVTERIEAQQQLEQGRAHLEQVLNNIPVAIAINSLDPRDPEITFLNDHFIHSLGYSLQELPRVSDWARLAYPDPVYREAVFRDWNAAMARAIASKGTVEQAEYRVRSADGRELLLLINAVVLGDMALVALVDVTPIRKAEQQLRKGIEDKLRVSLSASAVAHEISQPLSAIRINSQLALGAIASSQPDLMLLRSLLEPIASEAQRMDQITDHIRMLLRQVDTQRRPLDLREVVESACLQLEPALQAAGAELALELPKQPCTLSGDAVQLQLALLNLLRNGLEAAVQAGAGSPRLELRLQRRDQELALLVADNGPGFPEGCNLELPLSTTKTQGSGIGLYVVRLTAENHGGSVAIGRSERLGGAEVRLRLPLEEPSTDKGKDATNKE